MKKRIISLAIAISLALGLVVASPAQTTDAANTRSWSMKVAHQIAEKGRALGLSEDHVLLAVAKDLYHAYKYGTSDLQIGTYISARTGRVYGNPLPSQYQNNNGYYNNSGTYYDGYYWYYDNSYNNYYRIDQYGNRIWMNGNGYNYSDGRYSGGNVSYDNQNQYNNRDGWYMNKDLYNGVLTGVTNYVNTTDAKKLAQLANIYCFKVWSETEQAAFMWAVLNSGGGSVDVAIKKFDYKSNADTKDAWDRDLYALAQDVLFRYKAETTGKITKVGRVLPSNYTWVWSTSDGANYFRTTEKGANWTYDEKTNNAQYKSPYKS